jgi:hypothetical protein
MRLAFAAASFLLALASANSAELLVDPQKVLDDSRRERLETDKRTARNSAEQRKTEQAKAKASNSKGGSPRP